MITLIPKRITNAAEAASWIRHAEVSARLLEIKTGKCVQQVWENCQGKLEFDFKDMGQAKK
ncbi:hypothetical protein [Acidaminococcus sp. DS4831]|uniref:hypothetical protein n=1 Tax=Acidaminococcus sp. DS4831 TaxID=3141399 RepID=UPI0032E52DC2